MHHTNSKLEFSVYVEEEAKCQSIYIPTINVVLSSKLWLKKQGCLYIHLYMVYRLTARDTVRSSYSRREPRVE